MISARAIFQLNSSGVLMSLDIIRVVRYQKYCVGLLTCESDPRIIHGMHYARTHARTRGGISSYR